MVYCTKCGTKNPDDARVCSQCGVPLYPMREERERYYRRREEECFGIPRGGTTVSLAFGVIVFLWGLIWFLHQANLIPRAVDVWPFAVIIFGMLMIVGALRGMRRD